VDDAPLDEAATPAPRFGDRVRLLTSRPDDDGLVALVPADRFEAWMHDVKGLAEVVLIAAPEPADAPETLEFADTVDAVVVAVELGHTRRARLAELRRDLGQRAVVPAGFVIIGRRRLRRRRPQPETAVADAALTRAAARQPTRR
jgi:hypothetical protein